MARVFWALQMLVTPERVKTKMDESEDDETLNVKSERFNPLHALYSERLILPFPSAPVLDNVAKINSFFEQNNKNLNVKASWRSGITV